MKIRTTLFIFLITTGTFCHIRAEDPVLAPEPAPKTVSPGRLRADLEGKWRAEGLTLVPYKLNYFFPWSYNHTSHGTTRSRARSVEAKFQFSVKVLLVDDILHYPAHLYFGYTQLAMWQLWDRDRSAPFRDTNYEPELILTLDTRGSMQGFEIPQVDIGLVHQSNGTDGVDSRAWNRLYARAIFDGGRRVSVAVRPWLRIPESNSSDENPNISNYMGYGDVTLSYILKNHVLAVMMRNNLSTGNNRGALNVDYSFPLSSNLTGLVQYFTGYGESLVDYDRPNDRISVGLALSTLH